MSYATFCQILTVCEYEQPSQEPGTLLCNHLVAVMFCIKCYSRISISRDQQPITNCFSVILLPLQDDCWPTVIHIRILVWSFRICFLFGRWSHEIKFLIESSILIKQDPFHHSFLIKYDLSFWIIIRPFEIVLNHEPGRSRLVDWTFPPSTRREPANTNMRLHGVHLVGAPVDDSADTVELVDVHDLKAAEVTPTHG